jgi:2-alkyl-3-oxoalkanoate reductase
MQSPSNSPLRVALLGAGNISTPHAAALNFLPGVQLVGVCDRDRDKAVELQQRYGIPEVFDDLETMQRKLSPDSVHVLLPAATHANAVETVLRGGSHAFVEKPLCITTDECRRIGRVAAETGRQIGVSHNLTFIPAFLEVLEAIRSCRLGAVEHVDIVYMLPMPNLDKGPHSHWMFGSPERLMLELGPHPLSLIYRLLGRVTRATTLVPGEKTLTNGQLFFPTWMSSLACERGTAQMTLGVGRSYVTRAHIVCQDGEAYVDFRRNVIGISEPTQYLRIDSFVDSLRAARSLTAQSARNFTTYMKAALAIITTYTPQDLSIRNSAAAFYQAIAAGVPVPVGIQEGTEVVEACELIFESAMRSRGVGEHVTA